MKEIAVIRDLVEGTGAKQKAYLFYFYASTLYKKPFIINYTPEKLSKKTRLSTNTVRKYIAILSKEGYVQHRGSHLSFISKRKLMGNMSKVKFLWVRRTWSFNNFIDNYYTSLIERNIEQQMFVINGRAANPKDVSQVKKYRRFKKHYSHKYERVGNLSFNNELLLSSRSLSKTFNCPVSTTNTILNRLDRDNRISSKFSYENISYEQYKYIKDSDCRRYVFKFDGSFYIHKGRHITIRNKKNT